MNRKDLLAIIKEARAMIEYWSNYTHTHEDELAKMAAIFELCSWKERLVAAREEIEEKGVDYLVQEPMVIFFQFIAITAAAGIIAVIANGNALVFWPMVVLVFAPAWYAGYRIACAIDTLIERRYITNCTDILDRIDQCVQSLLK